MSAPTDRDLVRAAREQADRAWDLCAAEGLLDARGGMEYERRIEELRGFFLEELRAIVGVPSVPATPAQTPEQADALRRLARVHGSLVAWRVLDGAPADRLAVEFENGRACVLLPCGLSDGLLPNHSVSREVRS